MEKKIISILLILVILSMSLSSLILPIYASEVLTINVETDEDSYNVGDTVTAKVKWNKDMQAADFEIQFDAKKLKLNTSSIGEDYYNLYQNGKILVSWADENEISLQEITFTFSALLEGETEISITPRAFDTGNFDTEYTYQVVNKTITIIDSTQEPGEDEPETTLTTLEQYLIANGVDSNGDKALSDAEWATVKNLNLNGNIDKIDITGIEKAVNLKSLEMVEIDPSTIDFSKLTKLENLYIYGGIQELTSEMKLEGKKIKKIYLEDRNLEKLDISDLTSIEEINVYLYKDEAEIIFPDTTTVKKVNCYDWCISGNADFADLYPELYAR